MRRGELQDGYCGREAATHETWSFVGVNLDRDRGSFGQPHNSFLPETIDPRSYILSPVDIHHC